MSQELVFVNGKAYMVTLEATSASFLNLSNSFPRDTSEILSKLSTPFSVLGRDQLKLLLSFPSNMVKTNMKFQRKSISQSKQKQQYELLLPWPCKKMVILWLYPLALFTLLESVDLMFLPRKCPMLGCHGGVTSTH